MPNGHPYFLRSSADHCTRCGDPLCEHDRERVFPEDGPPGSSHYEYYCKPSGAPARIPAGRAV